MKRTLELLVADPISDALLREEITGTGEILADYDSASEVVVRETKTELRKPAVQELVPAGV